MVRLVLYATASTIPKMNICIDQGNSRTKVALFNEDQSIHKHFIYKTFSSFDLQRLFSLYNIENSIISSVTNIEAAVVNTLSRLSKKFILFDYQTPIPIKIGYRSPETLGHDRIAAAVGAVALSPNTNILIIDAGSAITYDFIDDSGTFLGGNIAPGVRMRLTVLKQMTKKLPLVETEENELFPLFGKTTRDAIAIGVVRGIIYEVKGYIRAIADLNPVKTFVTGGSSTYILNNLPGSDITYVRHLTLMGLNKIILHNLNTV